MPHLKEMAVKTMPVSATIPNQRPLRKPAFPKFQRAVRIGNIARKFKKQGFF